jgi:hypothetical protein
MTPMNEETPTKAVLMTRARDAAEMFIVALDALHDELARAKRARPFDRPALDPDVMRYGEWVTSAKDRLIRAAFALKPHDPMAAHALLIDSLRRESRGYVPAAHAAVEFAGVA